MSDKKVILVGYSGHAYVVLETLLENDCRVIGYFEKEKSDNNPFDLPYLGFEKNQNFIEFDEDIVFVIGIGDNNLRQNVTDFIESKGKKIQTVIHKTALISMSAIVGNGSFVNKSVIVNSLAQIGKNVILNSGCIIEHECILGDGVHIAPGAILAGNVNVGKNTFVGANAVIKQGLVIGEDVIIGAGTVVVSNIPDGKKVVGNPGRVI